MHCPRCQHENRPQATFCEACGAPLRANPNGPPAPSYAELTSALSEALEQQTATAEILRVIASSPTDVEPVLDAVAKNAGRLCETDNVSVYLVEGPVMRRVAGHGPVPPAPIGAPRPITLGSASGRAIVERRVVQIEDLAAAREGEFPDIWPSALAQGIRTSLAVPLLREGAPIGAIAVHRVEELGGGILLLLGLATRWPGLLFTLEHIVTTFWVKVPMQGWNGSELERMLLAGGIVFFLVGPGKLAIDNVWLEKEEA